MRCTWERYQSSGRDIVVNPLLLWNNNGSKHRWGVLPHTSGSWLDSNSLNTCMVRLRPIQDPLPSLRRGDPGGRVRKNQKVGPWAKIGIKAQKVSTLSHLIKPLPNQPTVMKGNIIIYLHVHATRDFAHALQWRMLRRVNMVRGSWKNTGYMRWLSVLWFQGFSMLWHLLASLSIS